MMRHRVFLEGIRSFAEVELCNDALTGDFTLEYLTIDGTRYECLDRFSQWLYLMHPASFHMAVGQSASAYILHQHARVEHSRLIWTLRVNYLVSSCDPIGVRVEPMRVVLRFQSILF